MERFRVALSSDFRKDDGTPTFPSFDLAPLGVIERRQGGAADDGSQGRVCGLDVHGHVALPPGETSVFYVRTRHS